MRIIHLSDLHYSQERLDIFDQFYFPALIKDLQVFSNEKEIDLILITGDLIDKGGKSFPDSIDPFTLIEEKIFIQLQSKLKLDKSKIIFAPGNHDIFEKLIDEESEDGLLQKKSIDKVNAYVSRYLNAPHPGIERLKPFKEFERNFHQHNTVDKITNFESGYYRIIEGIKVGIGVINTAWRSSPNLSKENIVFGTSQLLRLNEYFTKNETSFNILLAHYPIDLVSEIERKEFKTYLQTLNFDVLLCGHTHEVESFIGNNGRLFLCSAKTAFSNPRESIDTFKPGYVVFDFTLNKDHDIEIVGQFRKYIYSRNSFDKDVDAQENGTFYGKLISERKNENFKKYLKLTDKTCNAKQDEINTTLVIHGTDSIAPRDLNSIFVLPRLTDQPTMINDLVEDSHLFTIDEIISISNNVLIIGDKESGKTTLMHKIFIEASNNYSKYQTIPVELDFSQLRKKEIKGIVKSFLNEPDYKEIDSLLTNGEISLIIDNYEENNGSTENTHAINRLIKFINDYPSVKIILSTSLSIDSLLLSESGLFGKKSENEKNKEFKPMFIGNVGVNEFKELAIRWFKKKDHEWLQNNIEKLIKVFEILRIPRTFFAVSLFLWIVEKQENYKPVNKASLVQQFLLYILEGLRIENAKAGAYNFDKKIEILTELALDMYRNGNPETNYSRKETEAVKCLQDHFDLNQLKRFSASEKLREFIDKGILKMDTEFNVRFRYEAFFQYFLSLNIDKDKDLKNEVFSEGSFLSFIDELDYYTGRKRDDIDTLKMVISRLKESFEEMDKFIDDNVDKYFPNESFILKHIKPQSFISDARKNKLTEDEVDEALGVQMEMLPVDDSIKVKQTVNYKAKFYRVLELAARVLKNSENIKNPQLINESLDLIVNRAAKYGIFMQSIVSHNIVNNKDIELPLPPEFFITLAPIINQVMLLNWLGTDFLEVPFENKINRYLKTTSDLSEYELYLTGFLYTDMKMHDYINYLHKIVNKIENKFIAELCFMKVFLYYMFRPENSILIPHFEKIMIELLKKARNLNSHEAKSFVENQLRKRRDEINQQLKLDL